MSLYHKVNGLHFVNTEMVLNVDGEECRFELTEVSAALVGASDEEREQFQICPSGYGIHWPLLDEDLSVDGLLGITHTPSREEAQEPRL